MVCSYPGQGRGGGGGRGGEFVDLGAFKERDSRLGLDIYDILCWCCCMFFAALSHIFIYININVK